MLRNRILSNFPADAEEFGESRFQCADYVRPICICCHITRIGATLKNSNKTWADGVGRQVWTRPGSATSHLRDGDGVGDEVGLEVVGDLVGDGLGSEVVGVGNGAGDGVGSEGSAMGSAMRVARRRSAWVGPP